MPARPTVKAIVFDRQATNYEGAPLKFIVTDPTSVVAVLQWEEGQSIIRIKGGGRGIIVRGTVAETLAKLGMEVDAAALVPAPSVDRADDGESETLEIESRQH